MFKITLTTLNDITEMKISFSQAGTYRDAHQSTANHAHVAWSCFAKFLS